MAPRDSITSSVPDPVPFTAAVVVVIVIVAAVGVPVVAADAAPPETDDASEYTVVQGDQCIGLEPLGDGSQTVEEFYDYRTPDTEPDAYTYSSYGTTHLQADDTSILFLYEGSEGLSLVMVHDRYGGNSSGGALTMQIDGLPEESEWAIEDDNYSEDLGPGPFDEFDHGETSSRITWAYTDNRTDGAAVRGGLEDEFEMTIDPAFNGDADYRVYEGNVTDWQVISATDDGHERTSLDSIDDSLTVQSSGCISFAVTELDASETVTAGETIELEATVENDGYLADTFDVAFAVDGEVVDEQEVTLEAGESSTLTTTVGIDEPGTYTVTAGDASANVSVADESGEDGSGDGPSGTSDGGPDRPLSGFGVATAVFAALVAALCARRRT